MSRGIQAGILDADITGPSIPKMYGIHETGPRKWRRRCYPCVGKGRDEDHVCQSASGAMKTDPGHLERTDYRRRGDSVLDGCYVGRSWIICLWICLREPEMCRLTVFQSLPVDGVVIVTSPQELVQHDRRRRHINMAVQT